MAIFDQRNQKVNYQFNSAGNINIHAAQTKDELIVQMQNIKIDIENAYESGVLHKGIAKKAGNQLQKSIEQAEKSKPNKEKLINHLEKAKSIIADITAITGLIAALNQLVEKVQALF